MPDLDLEPIRARVEKTLPPTVRPWHRELAWRHTTGPDDTKPDGLWHNVYAVAADLKPENAEFISHARTDVPALIAEVERLRARVTELENTQR